MTITLRGSGAFKTTGHSAEEIFESLRRLSAWIEAQGYAGYEPYDILNAPLLHDNRFLPFPVAWLLLQLNKHLPTNMMRQAFRVPPSKNPKAIGLMLSAYCDLARWGEDAAARVCLLHKELKHLRSPNEQFFCWGYDWDYVSVRGSSMAAFRPNSIATVFCGEALLDKAEVFGDLEAAETARSVGEFFVGRLNRSVDTPEHLCFSYTPENNTQIFNCSALVGAFLARLGSHIQSHEYFQLARRCMQYLVDQQRPDGSWYYGAARRQRWTDGFHTGYMLVALLAYQRAAQDDSFADALRRGYEFYRRALFTEQGIPKYFPDSVYPVDIHSCSQGIIVFCDFASQDPEARDQAWRVLLWTLRHMQSPEGFFYYQRHRWWVNRVPYMRWGQAWMFRALTHFCATFLKEDPSDGPTLYVKAEA